MLQGRLQFDRHSIGTIHTVGAVPSRRCASRSASCNRRPARGSVSSSPARLQVMQTNRVAAWAAASGGGGFGSCGTGCCMRGSSTDG
jgi:hypothetical protein